MKSLLVVSNDGEVFRAVKECFKGEHHVDSAADTEHALVKLRGRRYDFVLVDLGILGGPTNKDGYKQALQQFFHLFPSIEIIVMTPPEHLREAVKAVKAGASNYLTYPIVPEEARYVTESVYKLSLLESELDYLRDSFWDTHALETIQTRSPLMRTVFEKVRSVAPTKATVLLVGETGTGKGVLAKLIHRHSNRKDGPFVSVHCGAIPDTLLESELFGHEKGAFTGAVRRKLGKFEIAKGGTIFLDEIATLTPSAQIKLLQIVQEGVFQRVGGEETLTADVRIVAATNMDLEQMTGEGSFRRDLYYRLNVFPIELPALSDRSEDIPVLVENFLRRLDRFHLKGIDDVHPDVMKALTRYEWPGNIRELENVLERAYILETSSTLTREVFPREIVLGDTEKRRPPVDSSLTLEEARNRAIRDVEISYLVRLLSNHNGRIDETARAAGIGPRQLHKLMTKHGLRKEDFKTSSTRSANS